MHGQSIPQSSWQPISIHGVQSGSPAVIINWTWIWSSPGNRYFIGGVDCTAGFLALIIIEAATEFSEFLIFKLHF